MTKLLITILITLSFTATSSTKGNFMLKKAVVSKSSIATIIDSKKVKSSNSYNCEDECYIDFDYCIEGLPPQSVEVEYCEMELNSCLDWCDSSN